MSTAPFARTPRLPGLCLAGLALLAAGPAAAAVPAGFSDVLVTSVGSPTDIAWTPDGRLLITTQGGTLRVFDGSALLPTPALTIAANNICTASEQGLLGVAVDPDFATNNFIYLFYTFETSGGSCVNRVSRFTLPPSNVISAATQLVLLDNMPSPAGNHNAGAVGFGRDGYLYVSIGDGGCDWANDSGCAGANDAARDRHVLTGKILRITKTGGIPPDNPFQGAGTGRCNTGPTTAGNHCQETFAWGLRNPFRFNFDPNAAGTRLFINDVGQGVREEIDEGQAGADYGWNCREGTRVNSTTGKCSPTPPDMVPPIFEYSHGAQIPGTSSPTNCNSITGGAFVPNGVWSGYDNVYLASDFVCGWIFALRQGGGGTYTASDFATGLGGSSAVTLKFNPFDAAEGLYYTTFAGGGQVRRIFSTVAANGPLDFWTLPPCRAVDTRNPPGPHGGPALAASQPRTFGLSGTCAIPATAKAVAVNVTAVNPSTGGFVQVYPAGGATPVTSTLNLVPGRTRANNAVVSLGTGGGVTVFLSSGADLHFILDVVGYFE